MRLKDRLLKEKNAELDSKIKALRAELSKYDKVEKTEVKIVISSEFTVDEKMKEVRNKTSISIELLKIIYETP